MVEKYSVGYREELCCYVFILFVFFHVKDLPPFGVEEYSLAMKLAKKNQFRHEYCSVTAVEMKKAEDFNVVNILV